MPDGARERSWPSLRDRGLEQGPEDLREPRQRQVTRGRAGRWRRRGILEALLDCWPMASIPSSQPLPPCPPSATRFVVKARTVNYNCNTHTESVLYSALNLTGNLTTAHYELVEQDDRSP